MPFTHDTEVALQAMATLVNTAAERSGSGRDELADLADLEQFADRYAYSGDRSHDAAEVAAVRAIRPRLLALWPEDGEGDAGGGAVVEQVNALLREHRALPQLVRHDGWGWHVHAVEATRPLADRIAVESALAVVDLVRADELSRMGRCAAADCDAVLVDLSRNRSKRYCDVGNCGNRANVKAYRRRQSAEDRRGG